MKFLNILEKNLKQVWKVWFAVSSSLFSILSIILSFLSWEDFGITKTSAKLIAFIIIILFSLVTGVIWTCFIAKKHMSWSNGDGKINICYADIMKISFPRKSKGKKIVVIPVNTSFDTIVDENLASCDRPLVSATTVHGLWLNNMVKNGTSIADIDLAIDRYILNKNIRCVKELTIEEKSRGKRKCFENGTTVIIEGKNDITFFLLALSEFDENNRAQSSKEDVIKCMKELLEFYDINGQGYEMYVTLVGTGRSRAGLSHEESLQTMKSIFSIYSHKIHGTINIVIYSKDKEKVSIFS